MTSNFLYLGLSTLQSSFLWRTAKTIFAQSNSPTPLNKAPGSFKLPLKHVCWEGGGGGENYAYGWQGTKRCIRRDLSLSRLILIFLIEPITGLLLRPIFRLILTGYIYSRYMYDGIEHFYYAQSYESLYELCTAYRFKDIKTFTNKSAKSTFELIHLIKTSLFSRFDLYSNRRHVNRGTSPLEHLYSRDSSVQGAQNLVLY